MFIVSNEIVLNLLHVITIELKEDADKFIALIVLCGGGSLTCTYSTREDRDDALELIMNFTLR